MIGALVLAAGLSRRMGRPKMVLPWGDTTVIGQVVRTLVQADVKEILVVTGGAGDLVVSALLGFPARSIHNPYYNNEEMLSSLQVGLANMPDTVRGALIVLGDQPQILERIVREVMHLWETHPGQIVMPSYQMRRGHPWVLPRKFWDEVKSMTSPQTMRDFLRLHEQDIVYAVVDTDSIVQDLDTPEQYQMQKRRGSPGDPD